MKQTRFLYIALVVVIFLVSCSSSSVSESFIGLQGTKHQQIQAKAGQTLHVAFQSTVTQGSLELLVVSPKNKILWRAKGGEPDIQTKDVLLPLDGQYDVQVHASGATGNYHLDYILKNNPTHTPTLGEKQ